jgi:ribonuclease P protein component
MLKKDNRLSGNKQIKEVFEKGKMRQSPLFGVLHIKDKTPAVAGQVKFGIVVSKKISKKAVERNRIRRKIYKEVGDILPQIKEGLRVVFLIKKAMLQASDEEIGKEVKKGLEKI